MSDNQVNMMPPNDQVNMLPPNDQVIIMPPEPVYWYECPYCGAMGDLVWLSFNIPFCVSNPIFSENLISTIIC